MTSALIGCTLTLCFLAATASLYREKKAKRSVSCERQMLFSHSTKNKFTQIFFSDENPEKLRTLFESSVRRVPAVTELLSEWADAAARALEGRTSELNEICHRRSSAASSFRRALRFRRVGTSIIRSSAIVC